MKKIQITNGMFVAICVCIIFVKAIGVTQGVIARIAGQDMWIATLMGMVQGIGMMYVTYLVIRRTPRFDFMELSEALLGRWFAKAVAIVIFVFFLAGVAPLMMTFVYHLQDYFLPEAPLPVFIIASVLVGAAGCFYGLEVMARTALIGIVFLFVLNVLLIIGSTNEFDIRNLLPVLESGIPVTFVASLHFDADWALATMLAALILPHLHHAGKVGGKVGMLSILAGGMMVVVWSFLEAAVLSAEVTREYTIACMKLARNAHIGNFLQRYEMIMIALYALPSLCEIMFCIYGCSVSAAKVFGSKSHRPFIPFAVIPIGLFSYWVVEDHFRAIDYLENVWPKIALPIAFGLPIVLLLLRAAMGKKLAKLASRSGGLKVEE